LKEEREKVSSHASDLTANYLQTMAARASLVATAAPYLLARAPLPAAAAVAGTGSVRAALSLAKGAHVALFSRSIICAAVVCVAEPLDGCVELTLKVSGMVCDGCSSRVEEALKKAAGVKAAAVDLERGVATVQVEAADQIAAFNALPALIETVSGLGFEAEPHFA
jgi:copper chaperone CopZ